MSNKSETESGVMTFKLGAQYKCPVHGIVEEDEVISNYGTEGLYCEKCYWEWITKTFPKLEEVKEDYER